MRDCGRVYHNFSPRLTVLYLFWGGGLSRVDTRDTYFTPPPPRCELGQLCARCGLRLNPSRHYRSPLTHEAASERRNKQRKTIYISTYVLPPRVSCK